MLASARLCIQVGHHRDLLLAAALCLLLLSLLQLSQVPRPALHLAAWPLGYVQAS